MLNIEKFKTAQERSAAFKQFCEGMECESCKLARTKHTTHCNFAWLDLEEEDDEKPMPCPFCGSAVSKHVGDPDVYIACKKCGYRSRYYYDMDSAIAAHNMFSKAAMEAKKNEVK